VIKKIFLGVVLVALVTIFFLYKNEDSSIKVGVLHSLSGTMATSERSVLEATLAAIEQINSEGGVMGKKLIPIVADGESNPSVFAKRVKELISDEGVSVIFGCWTSACRKEVKKVVENYDHLLFYPLQYEGIESSDSIVYLGQLPNQQLKPALFFALKNFGNDFFLVGSDYIYPRITNAYAKDIISLLGGSVVGERYEKLGSRDFDLIAKEIKEKNPKVILNTINGDSNIHFFNALYKQGITSDEIPVISLSITQDDIEHMCEVCDKNSLIGHYASWSYFDSEESKENKKFKSLMESIGIKHPTDPMASAYSGVWLYKQAVEDAQSFDPYFVKKRLPFQSYKGTGSIISLIEGNLNSWKYSSIAKLNDKLEFVKVDGSRSPIKPENYPKTRTIEEWDRVLLEFYTKWQNSWEAP